MTGAAAAIAKAIEAVAKTLNNWLKGSERRNLKAAVDAAEKFMQVYYKIAEFSDVGSDRQKELLDHYYRRFTHYN